MTLIIEAETEKEAYEKALADMRGGKKAVIEYADLLEVFSFINSVETYEAYITRANAEVDRFMEYSKDHPELFEGYSVVR